ncbi:hypothetical protein M9H77_12109 [Catharanthus roseus]|uniref:Uncharacterized protein n=1 Tax=Catharanthus roseus TaxID=4058 RepID=A0ACC0BGJ6_CATRO|nr:hypothetical protein M9H77_12109 [Catharanthus roseus]
MWILNLLECWTMMLEVLNKNVGFTDVSISASNLSYFRHVLIISFASFRDGVEDPWLADLGTKFLDDIDVTIASATQANFYTNARVNINSQQSTANADNAINQSHEDHNLDSRGENQQKKGKRCHFCKKVGRNRQNCQTESGELPQELVMEEVKLEADFEDFSLLFDIIVLRGCIMET